MCCIALVRCVLVLRCGSAGWCGILMQAEALALLNISQFKKAVSYILERSRPSFSTNCGRIFCKHSDSNSKRAPTEHKPYS